MSATARSLTLVAVTPPDMADTLARRYAQELIETHTVRIEDVWLYRPDPYADDQYERIASPKPSVINHVFDFVGNMHACTMGMLIDNARYTHIAVDYFSCYEAQPHRLGARGHALLYDAACAAILSEILDILLTDTTR